MKTKLFLMCVMAASAAYSGAAMPTEAEVEKAVPKVERMLASEKVALASGKMTRAEVAEAAMKLAAGADDEAAKLLLMKGAFILHVKDGDLEKAVKTMNALETAIADMPPQIVTNIIETALLGLPDKTANGMRLYRLLDESKADAKGIAADGENLKAVVDGYTWTYSVTNGEATIEAKKDGKPCCAVSPSPMGDVVIPSMLGELKVTSIGAFAFDRCDKMASVTIPLGVTKIGDWSFTWCRELMSVSIPSSVTSIANGAFYGCSGLTVVRIPASVTSIGRAVFKHCNKLKQIDVEADNQMFTTVDAVLYTKDRTELVSAYPNDLPTVTIPEGVTSIGYCAFEGFGKLTSVMMPESVKAIGSWAFMDCDTLSSLTIPASVANIGTRAFRDCRMLISVTMRGECPSAPNNIFQGCAKLKSIHVPANAKSWAGMTEWQGIPLVFDGGLQGQEAQAAKDAERLEQEKVQREAERAEQRAQLLAIQEEVKRVREAKAAMKDSSPAVRAAVESILKGMIKVPGRDYWLSATEVTQEQWEPIMEYNLSQHKGPNLPVEMVSRNDCDVFLEKLNQTKEVQESQFEFCLPKADEWLYAAQAGSGMADVCWIKPGVAGNVLDMAWVKENSSNQTHEVATKSPNAFGLYDMKGNVWEWLFDSERERGVRRGHAFVEDAEKCSLHNWMNTPRNRRYGDCGLRLAAHKKALPRRPLLGGLRRPGSSNNGQQGGSLRARRLQRQQEAQKAVHQENVNGYTWSFRVQNGEAEIVYENGGKFSCAVSPSPTGSITIPSVLGGAKVTSIGREALKGCDKITSVMMPLTLTRVGRDAFNGCRCLESLEMPPSIRDVEDGAFAGCCALTTVTIPSNVVRVGCAVFAGCTGLKQINVEEGNPNYTSVDGVLCTKDRSVLVVWPFGRAEVTIPAEVKVLGLWSFLDFDALKTITIPPTVTRIGWGAFHGCDGLTSVTIPSSVRDIDGCAFRECGGLESVTIPEGVTNIAYCAFYCCRKLASVTIPSSVRSIGVVAFEQCALTSVTIPSGVETLGEGAFKSCGRLETVKISEGLTSISKEAFKGCGALTSLTIPESVRSIGQAAFYGCGNLTSVTLPHGLRTIGGNAFMCCTKLKPVTIPASVTNVGGAAFAYCPEIKEHNLAADNQSLISVDGVLYTKDGKELVACPSGKTSVNILESVTNILSGSITGCGALKSLTIPSNVGIIGSWALSGSGVTSITLPQGLPCIEDCQFWGCGNLTEVTIPDSVTSIGGNAFRWCGKLTTVTIPKGVKSIGGEAFYDCGGLTSITMCGERPDAPGNVFKGCRKLKSIHVPANAKSWAGMKEWQGIPLVFDGEVKGVPEMTPVEREFKIGVAPGTVVEVDIGGCPLQFVSCPAGKFRMGYSEKPEVAACREIEISSPFWMTKGRLTMEQLRALGVQEGVTENKEGFACVDEASLMVEKLPQLLNKRFEGRVPEGYVFRLPTEAEFEYVQKAGAVGNDPRLAWGYSDDTDSVPNPWGVQKLFYSGRKDCFLDRVGGGKDVVSRFARNTHWTDLVSINYENQPSRDPVGWCEGNRWAVLRRVRNNKLTGRRLYGSTFYLVLAPDESRLNKFIWK